ncbi:MAG: hypothetical protein FJZ80_02970 [Bacteroidetes bacterium]|nr:hypothetical protein [Bacteroidota bacterium]
MNRIFFSLFLSLGLCLFSQEDLSFKANRRLMEPVVLNDDKTFDTKDMVEISCMVPKSINLQGTQKFQWAINGSTEAGKGWVLPKGQTTTGEKLKVYFTRVGNYAVSLTLTVTSKKKVGEEFEEEENEYSGEIEDFISVRSVFPELAAIYAQKPTPNYVKLVEKASEYSVKPKYANDPTPHLFLAKGYLGLVKSTNNDPRFESAMEECITSFNTARELDKNGVIFDDEHQRFLLELESYVFDENIKDNVSANPKTEVDAFEILVENIDIYSQISFAPITSSFFQAATKYMKKDTKGANLIWNTEIPKLKKYIDLDIETTYGKKFKDDMGTSIIISNVDIQMLKFGVMQSALLMKTRDGNSTKACDLLNIVSPWLSEERDFMAFMTTEFNNCGE